MAFFIAKNFSKKFLNVRLGWTFKVQNVIRKEVWAVRTVYERRDAIYEYLKINRRASVEQLAEIYQVNRKTIIADLDALTPHISFEIKKGRYGGIFVDKDWYPNRRYLKPEQEALLERLSLTLQGDDLRIMRAILAENTRS